MNDKSQLTVLAELILKRTKLINAIEDLHDILEESIRGSSPILYEDEEDDFYPAYGNVYEKKVRALYNGYFDPALDAHLENHHKKILTNFIEKNTLTFDVTRRDYEGQKWKIPLSIPYDLNDPVSERLSIEIDIHFSAISFGYVLSSSTADEVTEEMLSEMITLYALFLTE